ncbi:MAG: hypothetical protein AB1543_04970, partial [Candidatus Bipolaricaulota bacterium]
NGQGKRVFSTHALEAAVVHGLFVPWPAGVATLDEARSFWAIRDMSRHYRTALEANPDLRVIVVGSAEDHVQRTPDFAHFVLQYQGWQEAGVRWIRLNPDAAYVLAVAPGVRGQSDNDANAAATYANIACFLASEGVPDPVLQLAAVVELSDRVVAGNWTPNLSGPLPRP